MVPVVRRPNVAALAESVGRLQNVPDFNRIVLTYRAGSAVTFGDVGRAILERCQIALTERCQCVVDAASTGVDLRDYGCVVCADGCAFSHESR